MRWRNCSIPCAETRAAGRPARPRPRGPLTTTTVDGSTCSKKLRAGAGPPDGAAMSQQIRSLQALRGVACLAVVALHMSGYERLVAPHRHLTGWTPTFGWAGVDLFFVLSGFIITWTQDKMLGQPAAVGSYLVRRLWRIYPLYWACWAFAAAVHIYLGGLPTDGRDCITDWAKQ